MRALVHPQQLPCLCVCNVDVRTVAIGYTGCVGVWDTTTGTLVRSIPIGSMRRPYNDSVSRMQVPSMHRTCAPLHPILEC